MYSASLTHVILVLVALLATNGLETNQNGYDSKVVSAKAKTKQKVSLVTSPHYNVSYLDVSQNIKQIPFDNEQFELNNNNNKKKKKNPKRTIQKIIKRNKAKSKKLHYHSVTSVTKKQTIDLGRNYMMDDDISNRDENLPSTKSPRKKQRKTHANVARNPKPFYQLYQMKRPSNQRRYKRKIERDNAYIIQDLDEIKFLGNSNDYDTVNVHVKNYW